MEPEGSLQCSQEPATRLSPERVKSGPGHSLAPLCLRSVLLLSSLLFFGLQSGLFPLRFSIYAFVHIYHLHCARYLLS
jgi:hypothetical protein